MDNLMLRRRILLGLLDEEYIIFADPEVERICAETWGDGIGLKPSQAAAVSSVNTQFAGNTLIEYFDELSYFTGLTSFGQNTTSVKCFSGCTNLKSVNIPEGIVTIVGTSASGNYVNAIPFRNCSSLERIGFPSTLRKLGQDTSHWHIFDGCTALARVDIPSVDNYLGLSTGNGISCNPFGASTAAQRGLYVNGSLVENITVPSTITSIGKYLFSNNNTIKTVQFHSSLTSIGEGAFRGCTGLTALTIPTSVTSIGSLAFYGCSNIDGNVVLSSSVTSTANDMFYNCTKIDCLAIYKTADTPMRHIQRCATDGVIYMAGSITDAGQSGQYSTCAHFITDGDFTCSGAYSPFRANAMTIRIGGNYSTTSNSVGLVDGGSNSTAKIEFIEVMGTVSGKRLISTANNRYCSSALYYHFGYNGVACTPTQAAASNSRIKKVYVGDGSSQAADQAVLDQYLAISSWANVSSKLDLWYNYNGEYKTSPTIPTG